MSLVETGALPESINVIDRILKRQTEYLRTLAVITQAEAAKEYTKAHPSSTPKIVANPDKESSNAGFAFSRQHYS